MFQDNSGSDLLVYPNPSNGQFNIRFINPTTQDVTYIVTNILGQVVYNSVIIEPAGSVTNTLNLNDLADGIYYLTIKKVSEIKSKQIMIIR